MTFDHRDKKDLVCLSASRNLWTPGHTTESFNISVSELQLTFLCQKNYTWTEFLFPATDTVSLKNVEIWASCDLINSRTKIIQYKLNSGSLRDFWSICPWGKVHSADDDEVLSSVGHRFRDLLAKKKKKKVEKLISKRHVIIPRWLQNFVFLLNQTTPGFLLESYISAEFKSIFFFSYRVFL